MKENNMSITIIDKNYPNAKDEGWRIVITGDLIVKGGLDIKCNLFVTGSIKAGEGIKAGWGIKAGLGIKAGEGIEAGLGIKAKTISSRLRIFAGLCLWRLPTPKEKQIRCEQLLSGTIEYGELVITNPKPPKFIEKDGFKYQLVNESVVK